MAGINQTDKFVCLGAQLSRRLGNLCVGQNLGVITQQALHAATGRRIFPARAMARVIHQRAGAVCG